MRSPPSSFLTNVYQASGGRAPSWFELLAQEKLFDHIHDAVEFCVKILCSKQSKLNCFFLKWWEPIFLMLVAFTEMRYLQLYQSSISEMFYGLERRMFHPTWTDLFITPSGTISRQNTTLIKDSKNDQMIKTKFIKHLLSKTLSNAHIIYSTFFLVFYPYLKRQLFKKYINQYQELQKKKRYLKQHSGLYNIEITSPVSFNLSSTLRSILCCTTIQSTYYHNLDTIASRHILVKTLHYIFFVCIKKFFNWVYLINHYIFCYFISFNWWILVPIIFSAESLIQALFKLLYLLRPDKFPYWSLQLRILHLILRVAPQPSHASSDSTATPDNALALRSKNKTLRNTIKQWISIIVLAGIYCLRLYEWWVQNESAFHTDRRNRTNNSFVASNIHKSEICADVMQIITQPPPSLLPLYKHDLAKQLQMSKNSTLLEKKIAKKCILPQDPRLCPLCRHPRKNPVCSVGGYVFCFACLTQWLQINNWCPITGLPMEKIQLRRVFEDHS